MHKGTDFYMSPEVFGNKLKLYGQFTDIWGVGVMAFLLMGLRNPISDEATNFGTNIKEKGLKELFMDPIYSTDLQHLVYRMISFDYLERPSAEEILRHKCLHEGTAGLDRKTLFEQNFTVSSTTYKPIPSYGAFSGYKTDLKTSIS